MALPATILGTNGHIPVPGHYSNDTKADIRAYDPATGVVSTRTTGGALAIPINFAPVDVPVVKRPATTANGCPTKPKPRWDLHSTTVARVRVSPWLWFSTVTAGSVACSD